MDGVDGHTTEQDEYDADGCIQTEDQFESLKLEEVILFHGPVHKVPKAATETQYEADNNQNYADNLKESFDDMLGYFLL